MLPLAPHALVELPGKHTLPEQQPLGHVEALHVDVGVHCCCALHVSLPAHSSHATPPVPHALVEVPGMHTFPEQQPLGQVDALHDDVTFTQRPEEHVWLEVHAMQVLPALPHASPDVPDTHWFPEQQPVGQFVALQVLVVLMHAPLEHCSMLPHTSHKSPPRPHAMVDVPPMHWLFTQQPAQLSREHDAAPPPLPPVPPPSPPPPPPLPPPVPPPFAPPPPPLAMPRG